jgi:ribosomal protein S18 acetylase RimI-like enzyme
MSAKSISEVKIRPAIFPADKQIVSELFLAYAQSLPIKLDFQGFEDELAGLPGKYAVENGGAVFLAYTSSDQPSSQETVIGVVALRSFPTTTTPTCELKRLYLTRPSRGFGVSKHLMSAVLAHARHLDYAEMLLDTLASMTAARHLYSSYGFLEIPSYYPSVDDAVLYKLLL